MSCRRDYFCDDSRRLLFLRVIKSFYREKMLIIVPTVATLALFHSIGLLAELIYWRIERYIAFNGESTLTYFLYGRFVTRTRGE